jgi:all-trans-retinol 13,14-reductase
LEGGYFPKGGPSQITKNIIPVIEKTGGRVLVGKKVKEIIIENNIAVGVEMETGDKIYSKNVISATGINNTFNKLVNHNVSDKFIKLINETGNSTSFIYCFINLEGTSEELELRQSNLWIYPHKDFTKLLKEFDDNMEENDMPLFISSGSAKDSTWNNRYPDKSSIVLLCPANIKNFNRWESEECMKRNLDYKDFKTKIANRMINTMYKYYPKTKGKISNIEIGSPLTSQYYLGYLYGEGYGLESTKDRYLSFDLKPKTEIKNLYLTGQDICTLGFTGALMGGVLTAHSVLGYGTVFDMVFKRNLIVDLIQMKENVHQKD